MIALHRISLAVIVAVMIVSCFESGSYGENSTLLLQHARELKIQGKTDQALACFEKYTEIDPTDPEALVSMGELYIEREDYPRAVKAFSTLLLADPNNARVILYLGQASLRLGDAEKAKQEFDRVLAIKPTNVQAA